MTKVAASKWTNLKPRLLSGLALLGVGLGALWLGGLWWHLLVSVFCAAILVELVLMLNARSGLALAILLGTVGGIAVFGALIIPGPLTLLGLLVPAFAGALLLGGSGVRFAGICLLILLAVFGLGNMRVNLGLTWSIWLVLVVVLTDCAGYFAGRSIGGAKFWPSISPKKTWAGTVAGWIAAGAFGAYMMETLESGLWLIGLSVAVSFASQMGDISQSAIKRSSGVKDSSSLIPGHGGVWDRFDGMLAAGLLLVFAGPLLGLNTLGQ